MLGLCGQVFLTGGGCWSDVILMNIDVTIEELLSRHDGRPSGSGDFPS